MVLRVVLRFTQYKRLTVFEIKHIVTGFIIGIANLIPGVSGGTFALIFGVYERLIKCINSINGVTLKKGLTLKIHWVTSGFKKEAFNDLVAWLKENDYPFIMMILLGAALSILALSKLMAFLLVNHFEYTYAYFFGLIILSILIPYKFIKKKGVVQIVALIAGIALTVGVAAQVNPAEKVAKKSALMQVRYDAENAPEVLVQGHVNAPLVNDSFFRFTHKYSMGELLFIFIAGALAISAMVLPGVSGSLVLILLGQYFAVVSAIAAFQTDLLIEHFINIDYLLFLGVMALGLVIGLLGFSRLIEFVLNRYHDTTISFLVGLIAGSLYPLWPFKEFIVIDNYVKSGSAVDVIKEFKAYTNINTLPGDTTTAIVAVVFMLLGVATMVYFVKKESGESAPSAD